MRHVPIRQIGTIDGQRKAVAEFNPFFPGEAMRRECHRQVELHSAWKDAVGIVALLAFLAAIGLWIGAL